MKSNFAILCLLSQRDVGRGVTGLSSWIESFNHSIGMGHKASTKEISTLNEYSIQKINNEYGGIMVRHKLPENIVDKISIPIFSQHESPYKYIGTFNEKLIYLTDQSYLLHYPKSEIYPQVIENTKYQINKSKKYDVLFVGTFGHRKSKKYSYQGYALKRRWMEAYIDNMESSDSIFEQLRKKKVFHWILNRFYPQNKVKDIEWFLQHQIRIFRRDKVVQHLSSLADKGVKICFITNEYAKKRIGENILSKFDVFYDLKYNSELPLKIKASKIIIVSTPLHQSILNERFILGIENGALPIVEDYPQYADLITGYEESLIFNYKKNNLAERILSLLKKEPSDMETIFNRVRGRALENYGKEELVKKYKKLILKYS